ncbi:MAG: hypothetical protein HYU69_06310 [Bacteroidetes bacterium]|nr:hypothetical protein [Bacteroidota bacterium]
MAKKSKKKPAKKKATKKKVTAEVEVISYTEIITPSTIDNDPIMNEAPEQPQSETPTDTLF